MQSVLDPVHFGHMMHRLLDSGQSLHTSTDLVKYDLRSAEL